MGDRWIVLELGPKAEGEDPDLVRRSIRHVVKDAEVFIPAAVTSVGEEKVVRYLVEGYAFIRRTQPDATYMRLAGTRYVNSLLKTGRQLATVSHTEIERMRLQVRSESEQGIEVGDTVMIMSGPYRQITAVVHEDIPELKSVQLFIRLRSKEAMVTLPRNCLRLMQKTSRTDPDDRARSILDWFGAVWPILKWEQVALTRLLASHQSYFRTSVLAKRFATEVDKFYQFVELDGMPVPTLPAGIAAKQKRFQQLSLWVTRRAWYDQTGKVSLDTTPMRKTFTRLSKIAAFDDRFRPLARFVNAFGPLGIDVKALEKRFVEVAWLGDAIERLRGIGEDVRMIEEKLASEDVDMDTNPSSPTVIAGDPANVIVDGLNLAVRCCYAPGLSELKDSQGRPTGVFYGFLNSISSLRRRFPNAKITVAWDGSSRRRKEIFSGYKASRGSIPVTDWQLEWLRGTLPVLGVEQAWNPTEEADDVMATLVAGPYAGQRNVLYSSDRDLMQMVSKDTIWMSPPVGKAKETAHDIKAIEAKWGVPPEQIVMLRALLGDTSDEIPGLGIPQKVSTELVKAYGSVDKIYASRLAGLSKLQYDKLRASEKVVRRNVELMTLRRDLSISTTPPKPDRIAAETRLRDADVKPDSILAAFFGPAGSVK